MSAEISNIISWILFVIGVCFILMALFLPKTMGLIDKEKSKSTQLLEDMEQLLEEYKELNNAPTYDREKHEELRVRLEVLRKHMNKL